METITGQIAHQDTEFVWISCGVATVYSFVSTQNRIAHRGIFSRLIPPRRAGVHAKHPASKFPSGAGSLDGISLCVRRSGFVA